MVRWFLHCGAWLPCKKDWCAAMASVQAEERDRISKFVFQRDAKMALAGRLLLRAAAVRSEGVDNTAVVYGRTEKGKPILLQPQSPVQVNISHQGQYAVLALERGREVGVDVMRLSQHRGQSTREFFHTMRRQFTEGEWSHILAPPTEQQQLATFYRFWCLKESFIKAEGSGLSYGLQRLDFSPHPGWPPRDGACCTGSDLRINGLRAEGWQFQEALIDSEHCVSVAVKCHDDYNEAPPTFSEVHMSELLACLTPLTSVDHTHWTHFISRTVS